MTIDPLKLTDLNRFAFGDSPDMADRLAALVVAGRKTATCGAAVHGPETAIGQRHIVMDGAGKDVAVIETTDLQLIRFGDVTPEMAALEGEGDLSWAYWADAHERFFKTEGSWAPDMNVYFETFELVAVLDDAFLAAAPTHVEAERRLTAASASS